MKRVAYFFLVYSMFQLGCGDDDGGNWEGTSTCAEGVQRTISCEDGVKIQQCQNGEWADIGGCENRVCTEGEEKLVSCGVDLVGYQKAECQNGKWATTGECKMECQDGAKQFIPCPDDGEKEVVQTCENGVWTAGDTCEYPGAVCTEDEEIEVECGLEGDQVQMMKCEKGQWTFVGSCLTEDCIDGEAKEVSCGSTYDMVQRKKCIDGSWYDMGRCVPPLTIGNLALQRRVINDQAGVAQIRLLMEYEGTIQRSTEIHIRNSNNGQWLPVIIIANDLNTSKQKQILSTIDNLDMAAFFTAVLSWNDEAALAALPDETNVIYWDYIEFDDFNRVTQYATRNEAGELIYRGSYTYDETYSSAIRTATLSFVDTEELYDYVDGSVEPLLGDPGYFQMRGNELLLGTGQKVTGNVEFLFSDTTGPVSQYYSSYFGNFLLFQEKKLRHISTAGSLLNESSYQLASDNSTILPTRTFVNHSDMFSDVIYEYEGDAITSEITRDKKTATLKAVGYVYDANGNLTQKNCTSTENSYSHCISGFEGNPVNNYAVTRTYDTENRVVSASEEIDHDGSDKTDPITLSEWLFSEGNPVRGYTYFPRPFCTIKFDYPWEKNFIDNPTTCTSGPDGGNVTLEVWTYDNEGRVLTKKGYENPEDAGEGEADNPVYVQTIGYTGIDPLKPTEVSYVDNFSSIDDMSYQDFADIYAFDYSDDNWVTMTKKEAYRQAIPKEEAGYCTEVLDTVMTDMECAGQNCIDLDENGILNGTECGCQETVDCEGDPSGFTVDEQEYHCLQDGDGAYAVGFNESSDDINAQVCTEHCMDVNENTIYDAGECACQTTVNCTTVAETVCVAVIEDGVLTEQECDGELCNDADEDGFININTECATIYEETSTTEVDYELLYKKHMEGDLQTGLEVRIEDTFWLAVDYDAQGGIAKWMEKDKDTGDMVLEKTINPVYAPAVELFTEPSGDWELPVVLQAKRYNGEGTVVEEYEVDANTGWPLKMACQEECATSNMIWLDFYYSLDYAPEWFLHLNLPFDVDFDTMEETYVYDHNENTAMVTLKISQGEDALKTVWQKTTKKYVQLVNTIFGPQLTPLFFPTHDLMEFTGAVAVPIFWNEDVVFTHSKVAHYSNKKQTYDEETETAKITSWNVKYNVQETVNEEDVTVEKEHALVSSEYTDDVLTRWNCDYYQCYAGMECTLAKNAGLTNNPNGPCNNATIEIMTDATTFLETSQVRDRTDRIWSETTTDYVDNSKTVISGRESRRRLATAFEEEGNEDVQFETTLREVYEKFGTDWRIKEYYALGEELVVWEKFYYDSYFNISKKEFLEGSGQVATWHDYVNTYMIGSDVILNTVIKDEYGIPLSSIDYFWTNL